MGPAAEPFFIADGKPGAATKAASWRPARPSDERSPGKLDLSAFDNARIDACADLTTLERWLD